MTNLNIILQINNCEHHPLMVKADFSIEREASGWTWNIEQLHTVEVVIGDKVGIDITNQVLCNPTAKALVEAAAAGCDDQILEAIAGRDAFYGRYRPNLVQQYMIQRMGGVV